MKPILARTHAAALAGISAHVIAVETHVGPGLVSFNLVGMPDASVRESRDRVRAALQSCGIDWFEHRVTINLSPAGIPKMGSAFDLAIAVGLLTARRVLSAGSVDGTVFMSELGLDGSLRPIRGILPAVIGVRREGLKRVVVAEESLAEAQLLPGVEVLGFSHLRDLVTHFGGRLLEGLPQLPPVLRINEGEAGHDHGFRGHTGSGGASDLKVSTGLTGVTGPTGSTGSTPPDLVDVRGQAFATEGLLVAAAGGHHMLMVGEPGAGKTMLAQRLPTILPPLEDDEAIEVTAIHSICGTFDPANGLMRTPPIESPHHSATMAAIIGGGVGIPRPGAVSRAHAGVLVLDEAAEFAPTVLDALRQPLESGLVNIHRSRQTVQYPARFQLVLATNPCPCGHALSRRKACTCSSIQQRRYMNRLSGPLLDRVDLHVPMMTPSAAELAEPARYTSSAALEIVTQARKRANKRWRKMPWSLNAQTPSRALRSEEAGFEQSVHSGIENAVAEGALSLRGADRVLRLALTIADLRGKDRAGLPELTKALQFRNGVRYGAP